jgi:hypothetical protein
MHYSIVARISAAALLASGCTAVDDGIPTQLGAGLTGLQTDGTTGSIGASGDTGMVLSPSTPGAAGTTGTTGTTSTTGELDGGTLEGGPPEGGAWFAGADASADTGDPMQKQGKCDSDTPHGCYTPLPGNHIMCPDESPVQSSFYPPQDEWDGCNGIVTSLPFGQDPDARCSYEGPEGQVASCLCDTDLHWLCSCSAPDYPGTGDWPACAPP